MDQKKTTSAVEPPAPVAHMHCEECHIPTEIANYHGRHLCDGCASKKEIDRLALWFEVNCPDRIGEGGAVSNAIRLLEKML
jgi:hypothetical protein